MAKYEQNVEVDPVIHSDLNVGWLASRPAIRRSGAEESMAQRLRRGASAPSFDMGDISRVIGDLERNLGQLAAFVSANARHATGVVPDRMSDVLSDIVDRLHGLRFNARTVGGEAARVGSNVWHRIEDEVVERPVLALAVAVGIGFLIGALNKRD